VTQTFCLALKYFQLEREKKGPKLNISYRPIYKKQGSMFNLSRGVAGILSGPVIYILLQPFALPLWKKLTMCCEKVILINRWLDQVLCYLWKKNFLSSADWWNILLYVYFSFFVKCSD
jgi:hypothetical protein